MNQNTKIAKLFTLLLPAGFDVDAVVLSILFTYPAINLILLLYLKTLYFIYSKPL